MNIYGKIRFKDAIVIDEKLLRNLENTISQFFGKVSYSCRLCNDNRIEFESLDELLNFENVKIRKIVSLSMKFNGINEIQFEPDILSFQAINILFKALLIQTIWIKVYCYKKR